MTKSYFVFGLHYYLIYVTYFSHHLVARVYESKAEFRSALQHEKEGYTIYKNQVGPLTLLVITYNVTLFECIFFILTDG